MKLTFKKVTKKDFNYLLRLRKETMNEHFQNLGIQVSKTEHIERIMYHFKNALIIFYGEEKVGLLKLAENNTQVEILQIQIDKKSQGKGIGQKIINEVIEIAFNKNKKVTLSVLKGNKAINLYERSGFKVFTENNQSIQMIAYKSC